MHGRWIVRMVRRGDSAGIDFFHRVQHLAEIRKSAVARQLVLLKSRRQARAVGVTQGDDHIALSRRREVAFAFASPATNAGNADLAVRTGRTGNGRKAEAGDGADRADGPKEAATGCRSHKSEVGWLIWG